jgi:xylose dehydrogenase (NAD/NADP)
MTGELVGTVGWGFLGAGWIARQAMADAVHAAGNARLHAVASRDPNRSAVLEPAVVHATYADLLDDPGVEVVYICLANHQHARWAIRALEAGKHVLCEKPLGVDAGQVRLMTMAARGAGRLLVEAAWTRWHPRFRRLEDLAQAGALGSIVSVESAFTFTADLSDNYRGGTETGGGALLDVGGYAAHAWLAVVPGTDRLDEVRVERSVGASGVDLTTRVTGLLAERVRVEALCSFEQPERQFLRVTGSEAEARMLAGAAFTSWREPSSLLVGGHEEEFPAVDAYRLMVENVSALVQGEEGWAVPIADSLRVAGILDAIAATRPRP